MPSIENGGYSDGEDEPKACCCPARKCLTVWFVIVIVSVILSTPAVIKNSGTPAEAAINIVNMLLVFACAFAGIYGIVKRSAYVMHVTLILQIILMGFLVVKAGIYIVWIVMGSIVSDYGWQLVASCVLSFGINAYIAKLVHDVKAILPAY